MSPRAHVLGVSALLATSACGGADTPAQRGDAPARAALRAESSATPTPSSALSAAPDSSPPISPACASLTLPEGTLSATCARSANGDLWIAALLPLPERTKASADLVFVFEQGGDRISSAREHVLDDELARTSFFLHDFDGDGHDEAFLPLAYGHRLVTSRGGAIARYPHPHGRIARFDDADGDGRIEPIYVHDVGMAATCEGPLRVELLVASHTQSQGQIVMDDDVTQAELRRQCPSPPAGPLLETPSARGGPGAAARCARLWGRSSADVVHRLVTECAPHRRDGKQCSGPCRDFDIWLAHATADPPVRLRH